MESVFIPKIKEIVQNKSELEQRLKVKITIQGKKVSFSGDSLDEYEASLVFEALAFGFSARKSLQLKDEEFVFKKIHIRDHTRRKNLDDVKARLIGTHGKTRRVLESITECHVLVKESEVGIIASAESIDAVSTAVVNLIRGSKQSNVYKYLERMNKVKKEDLFFQE